MDRCKMHLAIVPVLCLLCSLSWTAAAQTQTEKTQPLTRRDTVLAGRLNLELPAEAVDDYWYEKDRSDLELPLIEADGMQVALYVQDVFRLSTGDLYTDAKMLNEPLRGANARPVYSEPRRQNDLEIVECVYRDSTSFVKSATVKMPDNSLVFAYVKANEAACREMDDLEAIADRVLKTMKSGNQPLDTSSQTVTTWLIETEIPQGYIFSRDSGADEKGRPYRGYHFTKLVVLGEETSVMSVYYSEHPSFCGDDAAYRRRDTILGREVMWQYTEPNPDNDPPFGCVQTLVDCDEVQGAYHIIIRYANDKDRKQLQAAARAYAYYGDEISYE